MPVLSYSHLSFALLLPPQAACEGTGAVKQGALKHNTYLAGVFLGGVQVLARMQVGTRRD